MRAADFTTLVTVDRNLTYQQHLAASGIAVIVLHSVSNRLCSGTAERVMRAEI